MPLWTSNLNRQKIYLTNISLDSYKKSGDKSLIINETGDFIYG